MTTTHHLYPPFPSDLPTAPLLSLSLRELESSAAPAEVTARLFAACRDVGFFYLDLTDSALGGTILHAAEELHVLQQRFFALPHEAKDAFGQDRVDPFFAYRWTACTEGVRDAWGRAGRREMYSVRNRAVDVLVSLASHLTCSPTAPRR